MSIHLYPSLLQGKYNIVKEKNSKKSYEEKYKIHVNRLKVKFLGQKGGLEYDNKVMIWRDIDIIRKD